MANSKHKSALELKRVRAAALERTADTVAGAMVGTGSKEIGRRLGREMGRTLAKLQRGDSDALVSTLADIAYATGRRLVITMEAPVNAKERKERPIYSGVLAYFPDALLEVAHCSYVGNEQHNPGEPLRWAKEKSQDEPDALVRHLLERGKVDSDGVRHSAKVAWRALANLQREIDAERSISRESAPFQVDCNRCPQDGELGCCEGTTNRVSKCRALAERQPNSYLLTGVVRNRRRG